MFIETINTEESCAIRTDIKERMELPSVPISKLIPITKLTTTENQSWVIKF
jgi:hypothetical protein